jgi:hypothetical protein
MRSGRARLPPSRRLIFNLLRRLSRSFALPALFDNSTNFAPPAIVRPDACRGCASTRATFGSIDVSRKSQKSIVKSAQVASSVSHFPVPIARRGDSWPATFGPLYVGPPWRAQKSKTRRTPKGSGAFCHWRDNLQWIASSGKRLPTPSRPPSLSPHQRHLDPGNSQKLNGRNHLEPPDACRLKRVGRQNDKATALGVPSPGSH